MAEEKNLNVESMVQKIMYDLVVVLNSYGITDVRAGAVMRLLGTEDQVAAEFDNRVLLAVDGMLDMTWADDYDGDELDPGSDITLH
tara:strand:- start:384 stop:641 length:258 start_codon:yes stop_codon:yes gene_type:complete